MKKFYKELPYTNAEAQDVASHLISHIIPAFSTKLASDYVTNDDIDLVPNYDLTYRGEDIGGYACTVFDLINDKYCYSYYLQNEDIKDVETEGAEADFCKNVIDFFEKEQKELQTELINMLK